jgi:hypothetical protein
MGFVSCGFVSCGFVSCGFVSCGFTTGSNRIVFFATSSNVFVKTGVEATSVFTIGFGISSDVGGNLKKSTLPRSSNTEIEGSATAFDFQASTTCDHDTIT